MFNLKRLTATASLLVGLTAFAPIANAVDLRLSIITPPPHQWTKTAVAVAAEIKSKTNGNVNILIFPSGQLGNESQMLQQLQTGALDFAFLTPGEFANRDPNYGIFLAPYLVKDVAGARKLLKGKTAKTLLDGLNKMGLVGFGYGMVGMRQIVMAGEVKSIEDLKNKKIRTIPFKPELDFWAKIGAAPTPMPLPALYDAFANGQVDGMQIDFEGTWNSKYYSHAGTIIESNHMMLPLLAVGSAKKWAIVSDADKVVITAALAEHMDKLVASYADVDAGYLAKLKETKVPVITVDRSFFGSAIDDWYVEWRKKAPMLEQLEAEASAL